MHQLDRTTICLLLAWIIALAATCFSLYQSEILDLPVCHLCWYQRMAIYPMTVLLAVGCFYADRQVKRYTLPLLAFGLLIAAYHCLIQWHPSMLTPGLCSAINPCSEIHWRWGFLTLPLLSLLCQCSLLILVLLA